MKSFETLRSAERRKDQTNNPQVLDTPEPLRNLADLIAAQLEYHKKAYEILSELAPVVDQLQVEQEVRRHQSSDF